MVTKTSEEEVNIPAAPPAKDEHQNPTQQPPTNTAPFKPCTSSNKEADK
jgi:hypothetical protein